MPDAPTGTITFLFTDIMGSSRLWEKFPNRMGAALARHDAIMRSAAETGDGRVFKTVGDAFCVAFATPQDALRAAIEAQRGLTAESWDGMGRISARMGIHTGAAEYRDGDYFGQTLNRTSRIEAAAHGGQILVSQISRELLEDAGLADIAFKSLGSHRLRNLDRPEHLFQVTADGLPDAFPPPRSMEVLPNNLPVQITSFVGRDHEVEELLDRLAKVRLLTLMGTGGTGKTRLSLEIGARVINDFRDGVWLAELAPITDPEQVAGVVAAAVGAREESGRSLRETLVNFLREKNLLLLLDNCEHLVATIAPLVSELLRTCPNLKIIAASRHALGVAGETTFPVPPLGMPDIRQHPLTGPDFAAQLSQYDAVKLFIDRAIAIRADFAVTNANAPALAEICSRLDGIPLAIELAAARVRALDLEQIAARLDDRFRFLRGGDRSGRLPHQQTLQALIGWSHDLLTPQETILFRRLGVFIVSRTLEALEEVCSGDGLEDFEILDLVEQLVDKSLVTVEREPDGPPRYTLIESVWQYARNKLAESGEENVLRDRHLAYYLRFAEKAAPRLEGPDQKQWLDRCHSERFNLHAAVQWTIQAGKAEPGFRIFSATCRLLEIRAGLEEARNIALELLALPASDVPAACRANFFVAAGRIAWAADRYEDARRFHEQAREIFVGTGDERGIALCEMLIGFLDRGDGNLDEAEKHFQRGLDIARQSQNNPYVVAGCLSGLGSIALDRDDLDTARSLKEESLALYKQTGDHWIIGLVLWGLADVCAAQANYVCARSAVCEWARITRDLGNRWMLPSILESLANLSLADGHPEDAARAFGAGEAAREHFQTQFSPAEQTRHESAVARLKSLLPEMACVTAWEEGRRTPPWDLIGCSDGGVPP